MLYNRQHLEHVHPDLKLIVQYASEIMDIALTAGHRTEKVQNKLFERGFSKLEFPHSKHNSMPSLAVDLSPYPIKYTPERKNIVRHYMLAGIIRSAAKVYGLEIRWGGDFDGDFDFADQIWDDLYHFELIHE